MEENKRPPIGALLLVGVLIFSLGFWTRGVSVYRAEQRLTNTEIPIQYENIDFSPFWEALGEIEDGYIGTIDYRAVVDGAITGMVAALGDPFSFYLTKNDVEGFTDEINGTFEGIGAEVSVRDGDLVIVAPLDGSPAEDAGIVAGDIIQAVDGMSVATMTLEEAIMAIRGPRGSSVTLSVVRNEGDTPVDITIRRATITVRSVEYAMLEGNIGHVRISRFDGSTVQLFTDAAEKLKRDGMRGMILDMRNNPGGYLDSAIEISSMFLDGGVVAIEEYRDGTREEMYADTGGLLTDLPLVVLVNGGSASGSEVVAGAIQDRDRGILVGEQTFGKGTVQEISPLSRGGALKLTIARWLTPDGRVIDKGGLTPDIVVESEGSERDVQLDRAVEEMHEKIKD